MPIADHESYDESAPPPSPDPVAPVAKTAKKAFQVVYPTYNFASALGAPSWQVVRRGAKIETFWDICRSIRLQITN